MAVNLAWNPQLRRLEVWLSKLGDSLREHHLYDWPLEVIQSVLLTSPVHSI